MNYILDTHVCIWAIADQNKLSFGAKEILLSPNNQFWISHISLFEIAIKLKTGKLIEFNTSLHEFIKSIYLSGYQMLPLKDEHLETYNQLTFNENHRDPFDRYILAVAHFENLAIITKDEKFQLYNDRYEIIW